MKIVSNHPYHQPRELQSESHLTLAQINIQGQFNKCTELSEALASLNPTPDAVAVDETWESNQ
jgi:tRNA1(Val) A37 N6-methylase TrmN6